MFIHYLKKEEALKNISVRTGETKLGEALHYCDDIRSLHLLSAKYVLVGIPEDIGVRANHGIAGTAKAYHDLLRYILNIQSNEFIDPNNIAILGHVRPEDLMAKSDAADLASLRALTQIVDERVAEVVAAIVAANKIPIVVGGGHNNSYGIIKGVASALGHPIHVLNIDPHSDFRALEGRHSGNGFRYAFEEGILDRYAIFGLHESYNNQECLDALHRQPNRILYHTFESMKIRSEVSEKEALWDQMDFLDNRFGIEIDMDSIEGMPTSAYTPSGFSTTEIRQYLYELAKAPIHYLHLAEAAPEALPDRKIGKMLTYLIVDFIKRREVK